ncbi:MAG: hypothetical protein FJ224_06095 [Lentisphaerae bacterium]|nr:hypothetical protein [Lentisphaerota bacterium]
MSKRNRKRKVENVSLPMPLAALVVFIVACALLYVWLDCRCQAVGRQLRQLENRRTELNRVVLNEEYKWVQTKAPSNIERTLARFGVSMSWPRPGQVVRIRDAEGRPLSRIGESVASHRYGGRELFHE